MLSNDPIYEREKRSAEPFFFRRRGRGGKRRGGRGRGRGWGK